MKVIIQVNFILFLTLGLIGCSNNGVDDNDVLELLKSYKTEQYTIESPSNPPSGEEISEKVKPYLTEEAFEELNSNRVFSIAPDVARKTNKPISIIDIQVEKTDENEDGTFDYTYILDIKIGTGSDAEIIKNKGQLTLSTEDGLKISRDWEEKRFLSQ